MGQYTIIDLLNMGKLEAEVEHEDCESCESDVEDIAVQVERAIKALPTLQEKVQAVAINGYLEQKKKLDEELEKEISKIELKYRTQMLPFFDKINAIVEGKIELKDEDFEGVEGVLNDEERNLKKNYLQAEKVSGYWLKVLQNDLIASTEVKQCDEPILQHLERIEASKNEDQTKLSVKFHFSPNDYFSNTTILKEFDLEGEEIAKSYGDKIEWKENKNVTIKVIKKKNKNKKTGEKKVSTKEVKEESFFNFFNPIEIKDEDENEEEEEEMVDQEVEQLETQFELANHIYEELIPYSIESFLGLHNLEDFGEMGGIEEMDEEDFQEEKPKKKNNRKKSQKQQSTEKASKSKSKSKSKEHKDSQPKSKEGEKPECKTQ